MFQNKAMMTLGFFVFMRKTIPYQSTSRSLSFRHPTNAVLGELPKSQFIGKDSETIEISGTLMPEITGGKISIQMLELMAESGEAFPLIEGASFLIKGWFVIESLKEDSTEFFSDGAPRKIDFSMSLKRVDESWVVKQNKVDIQQPKNTSINNQQEEETSDVSDKDIESLDQSTGQSNAQIDQDLADIQNGANQSDAPMTEAQEDAALSELSAV